MTIAEAQLDLRRAFVGGGPGALVSGVVWLAAAGVQRTQGDRIAFAVLFFGGMLIFPLSALLCQFIFRRAKASRGNVLGRVALESTIAMIAGLFVAWLLLQLKPEFVFPVAALAVGTHYFAFRTVYGDVLFWVLGALITAVGVASIYAVAIPGGPILAVGVIEILFALVLIARSSRMSRSAGAVAA